MMVTGFLWKRMIVHLYRKCFALFLVFIARRLGRSVKLAKKSKTSLKEPKVIRKKPKLVLKTKAHVQKRVSPSAARETVPRMYVG